MKKAFKAAVLAATIAGVGGIASIPVLVSAYGNNGGTIRQSYTTEQINNGELGDKITFNSISDDPRGHEFNYTGARVDDGNNLGEDNVWYDNIEAEDGQTYIVRLFAHNNSNLSGTLDNQTWRQDGKGVAENTKVSFSIGQGAGTKHTIYGIINSSNATPTEYYDDVEFVSKDGRQFHLEYVYGSALLENNGIASKDNPNKPKDYIGKPGYPLSDDVVKAKSGGVLIGYDALDGKIPGCYAFKSYVTIKVKVVYEPTEFYLRKSVRHAGTKGNNWVDELNDVKIGDELEYQITYKNTSTIDQRDVMIIDALPANIEYIPGTTQLWNANVDGTTDRGDTITTKGVNIGTYGPGANAYVRFRAKVVDENLACGSNTLNNWAKGSTEGIALQDFASVTLEKYCEPDQPTPENPTTPDTPAEPETPKALPSTGPEAIAGTVVGTGAVVTAAGYYIASRRSLR